MPPKRTACPFHQSGSCRKGDRCNMLHVGPPGAAAQPRPAQSNSNRRADQAASKPPASNETSNLGNATTPGMPPNTCKAFWTTGECENMFSCRFRHVKAGASTQEQEPLPPPRVALNNDDVADVSNPFTSALPGATLTPTQAHNHIRVYLKHDYVFRRSDDYYTFVSILQSANPQNNTWFIKDGQEFLQLMGDPSGNGIRRIQEIFAHQNVSAEAGLSRNILSFQRGYLPVLAYLSSEFVIRSTIQTNVNALYSLINNNLDHIALMIDRCMESCMARRSFDEPSNPQSGLHVFKALITALYEYVKRFKSTGHSDNLTTLVRNLVRWLDQWGTAICASRYTFTDSIVNLPVNQRQHAVDQLKKSIKPLVDLIERSEVTTRRVRQETRKPAERDPAARQKGYLLQMQLTYQPPGELREGGPQHGNDHASIKDIRIVPPHSELVSKAETYLPGNVGGAPHHLPSESMERLLDIQFRLLREELTAPIRASIGAVLDDLAKPPNEKTALSELIKKNGGLYKCEQDRDSIRFSLYTDAKFGPMACDRRGISVELDFDAPPGDARHKTQVKRTTYWESVGKKRLTQGGLVALIWQVDGSPLQVYLGVISSSFNELLESTKKQEKRVKVRVSFFDAEVELRILRRLQKSQKGQKETMILIESPAMFESVRPFLETLKAQEPTSIPFADYLPLFDSGDLSQIRVAPPAYAHPQFDFDLRSLFDQPRDLLLRPHDPNSVARARTILRQESRLDDTQAEAMVDALTSEVSLIQGPPGTGKSYTGIEILRVLIANRIRPILLIAFTNHALDNIIVRVLEKNITGQIVRLGSRSADETVAELSLDKILMNVNKTRRDRASGRAFAEVKRAEEAMKDFMNEIIGEKSRPVQLDNYLSTQYPLHHTELHNPPSWIQALFAQSSDNHDFKHSNKPNQPKSLVNFWREGGDLAFITYTAPKVGSGSSSSPAARGGTGRGKNRVAAQSDTAANDASPIPALDRKTWSDARESFFEKMCGSRLIPSAPTTNRSVDQLLQDPEIWNMSKVERDLLNVRLNHGMLEGTQQEQLEEFERLKERHREVSVEWKEIQDKAKLEVLANAVIIGCTTNGAANLTELLRSVAPRVLLVEEAGQVLEAHILASLVPSIQHMILIGDPLQLRPTIESYQLSAENPGIGQVYQLDRSLMERLSSSGLRMSRLDVQRRMRPEVSELIRCTLYPSLIDNDTVKARPSIRGMAKNVFFLDHRHAEGGAGEESVSKINTFEVDMIKDLVLHLLRQGAYNETGDIVVLCAYLGQLVKIRKALAGEVMTMVDERDVAQLVDHRDEDDVAGIFEATVQQVKISSRVLLRTVDNFQGEEGRVVILSLVRNSGGNPAASRGIGFLKSKNRTNVALSRAKEGMYILGNADDLARSEMWCGVIAELKRQEAIGPAIPIACYRHPENITPIDAPGQITLHAPAGGCLFTCKARLDCGHLCPLQCHLDDQNHRLANCRARCLRMCARGHPCDKLCAVPCGKCQFPSNANLPCGHSIRLQCWQVDFPSDTPCEDLVAGTIPPCEAQCLRTCARGHPCNKLCTTPCGKCQSPVNAKRACGHSIRLQCWQVDFPSDTPCEELVAGTIPPCEAQCIRTCARGHPCNKLCTAPCGKCQLFVNAKRPCGHYIRLQCWQADLPLDTPCKELVTKAIPTCGHPVEIACSVDPRSLQCQSRCDLAMACCSESCGARCSECQALNHRVDRNGHIERRRHARHPCGRDLRCQHQCGGDCSEEHDCSDIFCQERCRQICSHHACKRACSEPCVPCMEPCDWACDHHACPVVCSAPCARLPCDLRCSGTLSCGHPCPSVCGEPCEIQICPTCAPDNAKSQVVEFIMQSSLSDVDIGGRGLDSMLITLECGHVFTAETLDGLCELASYYKKVGKRWLQLATPPQGLQKHPLCPLCRVPIKSKRYGRMLKRADLDLSEQNVANKCRSALRYVSDHVSAFNNGDPAVKSVKRELRSLPYDTFTVPDDLSASSTASVDCEVIPNGEPVPVASARFGSQIKDRHQLPEALAMAWNNAVSGILQAYDQACAVASTNSAHVRAWEAAVATLRHRYTIEPPLLEELSLSFTFDEAVLKRAKKDCGASSTPKADQRFRVEACWTTIHIRFLLIHAAQRISDHLQRKGLNASKVYIRWEDFITYMLSSIRRDAALTLETAEKSRSYRQVVKTAILAMEAEFQTFSHQLGLQRNSMLLKEFEHEAREGYEAARAEKVSQANRYRLFVAQGHRDDRWLVKNFMEPAQKIIDRWVKLILQLKKGVVYAQALNEQEKEDILKTFIHRFLVSNTRGHFYQCSNGHVYSMAECGDAVVESRCPECGCAVGGRRRTLHRTGTNTRAMDLENLAR